MASPTLTSAAATTIIKNTNDTIFTTGKNDVGRLGDGTTNNKNYFSPVF